MLRYYLKNHSYSLPAQYLEIHKALVYNVFPHAGKVINYNISIKEWVLDGDTVLYGESTLFKETLEYDFKEGKSFDYSVLTKNEFISHIAKFIANIWQIHVFSEGNKVDIGNEKVDIRSLKLTSKMKINIDALYRAFSTFDYFGRNEIINALNISSAEASNLFLNYWNLRFF